MTANAAQIIAATMKWRDHCTTTGYAARHGVSAPYIRKLMRSGALDFIVVDHGVRLIHKDADIPEMPRRASRGIRDGVPVRRCPSCCEWKSRDSFGSAQWNGGYGGTCSPCMREKLDFLRETRRDPALKAASDLAMARDREILAARSRGDASVPPESRIQELIAWAQREGLRGSL